MADVNIKKMSKHRRFLFKVDNNKALFAKLFVKIEIFIAILVRQSRMAGSFLQ